MRPMDDELDEGLKALADEHVAMEVACTNLLEEKWAIIRTRAEGFINSASTPAQNSVNVMQIVEVEVDDTEEVDDVAEGMLDD